MLKCKMIDQTFINSILSYNPQTGDFMWKHHQDRPTWANTRYANTTAGCERGGYITIRIGDKDYPAHRLAFLIMTGYIPKVVDHINGIKTDNRWINLREATVKQNSYNRTISKNNSSGHIGVSWCKRKNKWKSYIRIDGKLLGLGSFSDINDAIRVRKMAEEEYFKNFQRK
jgi:hypothetical protein